MKKIEYLKLEVMQPGMPTCDKQTLELFVTGNVKQTLAPMVYFGQARVYDYTVESSDIEELLSSIDVSTWNVSKNRNSLNTSYSCFIRYSDGTTIKDNGYRTSNMSEGFISFDDALLEMIPFIERPWLFSK